MPTPVRERNRLNQQQRDFKDLKFLDPESWRVVICGRSPKDHQPHRVGTLNLQRTPGTHTLNGISAGNLEMMTRECGIWGLGGAPPLPMIDKRRTGEVDLHTKYEHPC
jgi:hypothetical protein